MTQAVFGKAVKRILPSAIPAHLEKIDEYEVGKVLIYSKKPRKLIPMRKHELDFTGWHMRSLVAEGEEKPSIVTARSFLFDTGVDTATHTTDVEVGGDGSLEAALAKIASAGGDFDFKVGDDHSVQITTDFGKVTHISTDLVTKSLNKKVQLQVDHPIVQRAIENGGVMFVICNVYEGERCNVKVTVSKVKSESLKGELDEGKTGGSGKGNSAGASESVSSKHGSSVVMNRAQPTPLAYILMKLTVDSKGVLTAKLNNRFTSKLGVSHPYPTPSSEISSAKVGTPASETAPASADGGDQTDGVDIPDGPMPDEHYLFSLKDFQPFESMTYRGIFEEAKLWVIPVTTNGALRDAFFHYMQPPQTYERLNDLSAYLLDMGNAIRMDAPVPANTLKDVDPVLAALSEDKDSRLKEIASVVVIAEAGDEFPQHIVPKIVELPADKRRMLEDLILSVPHGSARHVFTDEGPFKALRPILSRIGFSLPPGTHHLVYTSSDEEEDPLASTLILLAASEK